MNIIVGTKVKALLELLEVIKKKANTFNKEG